MKLKLFKIKFCLLLLFIVTFLLDFFLLFSVSTLDEKIDSIFKALLLTESPPIESITISFELSALSSDSFVNKGLNKPTELFVLLDLADLIELVEKVFTKE